MLNILKTRKKQEGFTIIEVLIVLAIAALILLIVFLAVPALQRNSRNTSRKSDAGRVSASIADYVSQNNGKLPITSANMTSIVNNAGSLGQYTTLTGAGTNATCTGSSLAANSLTVCDGSTIPGTGLPITSLAKKDGMLLATQAQCSTTAGSIDSGTSRQGALVYSLESGTGNGTTGCINI